MAISINYNTSVISVPKADSTLVSAGPPEIRDYDVFNTFWKELKALEDDADGMPFVDAQRHNTEVTIGGVTLSHTVEVINGFTVTFEDGSYELNVKGANHNLLDVANLNTVGLRSSNSAGLQSGVTRPRQNAALDNFAFVMLDATTGKPKTGLTVSGFVIQDAGSEVALTNSVAEVGNGGYRVDLTAAEMNGALIRLRFTASGADDTIITIVTATSA